MKNKKQVEQIRKSISSKSGRFFTLTTKFGDTINAKLVSLTDCYVTVKDNNSGELKKFSLSSVASA